MKGILDVAIVEDNSIAGRLIKDYLECDDICVTAIYASGEEAMRMIPTLPLPDVVLMDIGLPDVSGVEVTRRLKELYPDLEIVVQTVFEDGKTIVDAIKAGASGYILKASAREEIINALRSVKRGESFLSGKVARKVLQEFHTTSRKAGSKPNRSVSGQFDLTEREEEILEELINGSCYKEIANKLCISIHTVNNHIRHIYEKMQVRSRGEAVAKVLRPQSR